MFFPDRIKNIKLDDKVLEVGPGALPFYRADVFLEKNFSENEVDAQRGFAQKIDLKGKIVYYDGGKFPFKDKEFDYVVCSHVLEHVPPHELPVFISELERVAQKGYLEFPNVFYELINYQPVHLWLMNYRDECVYFLDKSKFKSNFLHLTYRDMIYANNFISEQLFSNYKEVFFCGFEWNCSINYKIIDNFEELVTENDYLLYKKYFKNMIMKKPTPIGIRNRIFFLAKIILGENIYNKVKKIKIFFNKNSNYKEKISIKKTAVIEDKKNVKIDKGVEIGDGVIIKAFSAPIEIGEFTQINPFTVIYGHNSIFIGKNVMIAPHCMIASGNHDFEQTDTPMRFAGNLTRGPIIIEDNVWIGANCTITDGVKIGHDAVVGANSLVNKDVQPYDIVGGVPAKVIKNRLKTK